MKRALGFMNKSQAIAYNTFVGGVSATISTAALLATKLGISVANITNFEVVGSDIKCFITGSYAIPANAFVNSTISYFADYDGLVTSLGASCFSIQTGTNLFKYVYFPNVISVGVSAFNCANYTVPNMDYIYIPRCTSLGTSPSTDSGIFGNQYRGYIKYLYVDSSLATVNSGSPDPDLTTLNSITNKRYVTSFTAPNSITDLNAGNVYNTAIQLNFTPPSSTNAIDYYECYVNGVFNKNITASGQYITGLTASTPYNIEVYVRDIFYNKSAVSNTLTQSTNTTSAQPTTGLVSYYKLDANSNDSYGSNNGTDTSVSYVSGKISNAGSYNGTSSKSIIGNPANLQLSTGSISCWIKASASGASYRSIFGKTLAYNMFLKDGVLIVYNWSSYGTTGDKSTGINLNDGLWHNVVFVFESSTALNYLYIDGVLKLTFSWAVLNQTDNFCIGSSNSVQNINALIDEACVYNTKLTQTDIDLIYNAGNGITL